MSISDAKELEMTCSTIISKHFAPVHPNRFIVYPVLLVPCFHLHFIYLYAYLLVFGAKPPRA